MQNRIAPFQSNLLSREFMPGGALFNCSLDTLQDYLFEKYGSLVRMPGIMDRPEMLFAYDPEDFKKVYRTEGQWPHRRGLETFTYFRKNVRPDLFGNFRGLVDEWVLELFHILIAFSYLNLLLGKASCGKNSGP